MPTVLSKVEIEQKLQKLTGWEYQDDAINKKYLFSDFSEALGFLVRIGIEAEKMGHHPEIFNVYNRVHITLRTHDVGNKVSDSDTLLAEIIESLV